MIAVVLHDSTINDSGDYMTAVTINDSGDYMTAVIINDSGGST